MKRAVKTTLAACLVGALSLVASAAPARAAVTIGQLSPVTPALVNCSNAPFDIVQPTVTSGNSYVVPALPGETDLRITSWSTTAVANAANQMLTFKVFRLVTAPITYLAVGHDGPRVLTPGIVNTFPTDIRVRPGDIIGLNNVNANMVPNACVFDAIGDTNRERAGNLADGASGDFNALDDDDRANVTAVVTGTVIKPSNSFTLGAIAKNKKNGTATLTVTVPGPGVIALSGDGVAAQTAGGPRAGRSVSAGQTTLLIKSSGKKRKKLKRKGKTTVSFTVTYTPTGGDARTQSSSANLKKKRKKRKKRR